MYYLIKVNFIQICEKIIQNTNQKDPYILPTAKYIVRINNKKDTREECLLFGLNVARIELFTTKIY